MSDKSTDSETFRIDLEPVGRRVEVPPGTSLLAAARMAGVQLISICGGVGSCDGCKIRLAEGELTPPTSEEREAIEEHDLIAGWRLACQSIPLSDVKIDVPPESLTTPQRLQIEGKEREVALDAVVIPVDIQLDPPSLHDLRADDRRLVEALQGLDIVSPVAKLPIWQDISNQLRAQGWSARLGLRAGEVVAVLPPKSPLYGLAVDVGTTKLAAYLVDLESGVTLAKSGAMNPQIGYGEDVVSRIVYVNEHEEGRLELQSKVVEAINELVIQLCDEIGASPNQVVEAVVVGNTVMHHLFAGLPVRQLGLAPYVPSVADAMEILAGEVGLTVAPSACVYLPPNIAGYVGADHVAMLLATGMHESQQTALALDIGTNTEISLAHAGRLLSCSCASGPAFEGAHIRDGMRAAPGAIERVQISGGEIHIQTIGEEPPVGICGSGILDAVSEMVSSEVLDHRGAIRDGHPLVRADGDKADFLLVPAVEAGHQRDIVVTRKDVNEIQLAKGAIRAGIEILLGEAGLAYDGIEEFIVAGAFGTYLSIPSAIHIGMFPALPIERFRQVGNAAGMGAKQMLISGERRRMATEIVRHVEYLELTTNSSFTEAFMHALHF
jgi:uncharacterized 2Fe-2S/4Fe-4S cluster protein (DUF4445 family)